MSKDTTQKLEQEISQLKKAVQGLTAQVQAGRELQNEYLQTANVVRTNFILLKQSHDELHQKLSQSNQFLECANKQVVELNAENDKLRVELEQLKKPAVETPVVAEDAA